MCDNDAPNQITALIFKASVTLALISANGITASQQSARSLLIYRGKTSLRIAQTICDSHDTLEHATVIDSIVTEPRVQDQYLGNDPASWPESSALRQVMGDLANKGKWIKRIDYAENVFDFALPHLARYKSHQISARCTVVLDTVK